MSTIKSATKAELIALLIEANKEREALRVKVAELSANKPALKPTRPVYTPPAPTAEQLAFRASLAAARELAMRTGKSVRVGA